MMRERQRFVGLVLFALGARAFAASLPVMYGQWAEQSATVSGVVVDGATGEPVRDVRMFVANTAVRSSTDAEGRFRLDSIPPGAVILRAEKPGYSAARLEARKVPGNNGIPVRVVAGEQRSLGIRLWKAPIVVGTILDLQAQPLQDFRVTAFRYSYDNAGNFAMRDYRSVTTNDLGDFRFNDLDPGEYGFRVDPPGLNLGEIRPVLHYSAYYPGVTDPQGAELVRIAAGEDVQLRNFIIPSAAGGRVRLRLVNEDGESTRLPARIQMRRRGEAVNVRSGILRPGIAEADVGELPAGAYIIQVDWGRNRSVVAVDLDGRDAVFEIRFPELAAVSGRVLTEPDDSAPARPIDGVVVQLFEEGFPLLLGDEMQPTRSAKSGEQRTFTFPGLPPGLYRAAVVGIPAGMYLISVKDSGRDVLKDGLEIRSRDDVHTLDVVLGTSASTIRGVVIDRNGDPMPGAVVALLPTDRSQPHRIAAKPTDANGAFEIECAPGEYALYAWTELDGAAYRNREFMTKFDDQGLDITVEPGSRSVVQLRALE